MCPCASIVCQSIVSPVAVIAGINFNGSDLGLLCLQLGQSLYRFSVD